MKIKKIILTIVIGIFVCILGKPLAVHAVISGNDSCLVFQQGCYPGPFAMSTNKPIGYLIAEGAGFYFTSMAKFMLLLEQIEMAEINGLNCPDVKDTLVGAIDGMEKAKLSYFELWNNSIGLEYNADIVLKLKNFNYALFRLEKGFNVEIFRKVEKFLRFGDVKGVYNYFYRETNFISGMLQGMKPMADTCVYNTEELWKINQRLADTLLFGQYVAQVFNEIKK